MRLIFTCKCDGKECNKTIPSLMEDGTIIEPEEETNPEGQWTICSYCERNHVIGSCRGFAKLRP